LAIGDCDEGSDDFAVFLVRDTDHGCNFDGGMSGKAFFNLERVDVFSAWVC
jgi:hypothetical protein